jgi:hypothetical protein
MYCLDGLSHLVADKVMGLRSLLIPLDMLCQQFLLRLRVFEVNRAQFRAHDVIQIVFTRLHPLALF